MKRLLAKLASKAIGIPSIEEYAQQNLALFFDANEISEPELNCYKIDRNQERPHLYNRVYVGHAKHKGKLVALVISYDEDLGYTEGKTYHPKDAHLHRTIVTSYKANPSQYRNLFYAFYNEWELLDTLKNSAEYR